MRVTKRPLFYWITRRYRWYQFLLLIIIVVSLFFRVFPLEMQKRIVNEAIHLRDEQLLFLYCGLYVGAVTIASLLKYIINILQTVIGQKILVELRKELYHHILQLPLQFYRKMQPGTVISAMTAELNAIGFFLGGALAIPVTSVLTFLVFLGFMYNLSPLLALLSMSIYPFELIVIPLLQRRYNRLNKKRIKNTRAMGNIVNEAISGIHEVHSNSSYPLEENRLSSFVDSLYRILKKLFIVKYGMKFANNMFQSFGPFILFIVGGYLAIHGEFTLGALVAFLSAYQKVYDPWKELLEYYQDYQDASVRYKQIMKIFDLEPEHIQLPEGREPYSLIGDIELKQAGFSVGANVKLLDRITARIKPNEMVALVGFSGSGKSTLALLIAQLYSVSKGSVLLDGNDINSLSKADISKNITMISQSPFIFTGTIRENLLYAVQASIGENGKLPDRETIFQIIRDVGLEDDMLRFGFNMVLPRERVNLLKDKFLNMRQIIHGELGKQFAKVVEFYDPHHFLRYCSLRDNIIFGDSMTDEYDTRNLPGNTVFMAFLKNQGLEKDILELGLEIADKTVSLLRDIGDDEFFFQGSPMKPDQFDDFTQLVDSLGGKLPRNNEQKDKLLLLALRFIPALHSIIDMPKAMADKIVAARHSFLEEVMGVDIDACFASVSHLKNSGSLLSLPAYKEEKFIAFCPTEYLFKHSLKHNILFGSTITEGQEAERLQKIALEAFKREGLLDEILDIGLDFEVGSKGDRLSGGQKQKVAIARALLKDTPILIMDEATASLDNKSQAKVHELLEKKYKGTKTIIAVIHRLDMASTYDRIIVLKAGTIIEQGTYDELIASQGAFYELVHKH